MKLTLVNICFNNSSKQYQYLLDSDEKNVKIGVDYKIPTGFNKHGTIFKTITVVSMTTVDSLPNIVTSGIKLNSTNFMANTYSLSSERIRRLRMVDKKPVIKVETEVKPIILKTEPSKLKQYIDDYCIYFNKVTSRLMWKITLPKGQRFRNNCNKLIETIDNLVAYLTKYGYNSVLLGKYGVRSLATLKTDYVFWRKYIKK